MLCKYNNLKYYYLQLLFMFKCKKCGCSVFHKKIHFEYKENPKTKSKTYEISLSCADCGKISIVYIALPNEVLLNL